MEHGKLHGLKACLRRFGEPAEEAGDGVQPGAFGRADQGHRCTQLTGQRQGIDFASARGHQIRHVQQHHRRQAHSQNGSGQHELAVQLQCIEYQQDCVRSRRAGHVALQHIDCDPGVF